MTHTIKTVTELYDAKKNNDASSSGKEKSGKHKHEKHHKSDHSDLDDDVISTAVTSTVKGSLPDAHAPDSSTPVKIGGNQNNNNISGKSNVSGKSNSHDDDENDDSSQKSVKVPSPILQKLSPKAKKTKHRNLALHLAHYSISDEFIFWNILTKNSNNNGHGNSNQNNRNNNSSSNNLNSDVELLDLFQSELNESSSSQDLAPPFADSEASIMDLKRIQIFTNLTETDDAHVTAYCLVALANISSVPLVRTLLLETNILNKLSTLISNIKESTTGWACCLLFYYLSCEKDAEDRVLNAAISFLFKNMSSVVPEVKSLILHTFNNLLPSVDRLRVTGALQYRDYCR